MIRAQPPFLASSPMDIPHTLGQRGGGGKFTESEPLTLSWLYTGDSLRPEWPPFPLLLSNPVPTLTLLSFLLYTPTLPTSPFQNEFLPPFTMPLLCLDHGPSRRLLQPVSWWPVDVCAPAPGWPVFPAGPYLTGAEMPSEWIRGPRLLGRMLLTWGSAYCLGGEGGKLLSEGGTALSIYYMGSFRPAQGLLPVLALGRRAVG